MYIMKEMYAIKESYSIQAIYGVKATYAVNCDSWHGFHCNDNSVTSIQVPYYIDWNFSLLFCHAFGRSIQWDASIR